MSRFILCVAVAGATGSMAGFASALDASELISIGIWHNGELWSSDNDPGAVTELRQNENGDWVVEGNWSTSDWASDWSFEINPGAQNARGSMEMGVVVSSFNFTNTTGIDGEDFQLVISAFVNPLSSPTIMTGSLSGSLNSGDPGVETATMGVPTGDFLYTALADGSAVRTLVDDTFSTSTDLTTSFGSFNFAGEIGPSVTDSLGIRHSFTLSADDNVNFVGAFVVQEIPTPGGATLLALGGLAAARRRR